jgi:DNA-binding SARP family transcriptional activator/tetratricopeptide (TPR) repeat protein
MIYRLLGELQVGVGDSLLELPGGPTLLILATLLVNANRQMSKAALIRLAWEEEVGEAQLPKRIGMVRELLDAIGRRDDLKTHPGFGYELRVGPDDIDTLLFQRLVRDAEEAGRQLRADDEIGCLRRALRLWRGPHPLSNIPDHAFRPEMVALEQRHKRAAARLFELELARDNHEGVLDELILTAGYYPTDRRLCEQLMITQYRCGHVADVVDTYERYRMVLGEETGSDPDPLLRALHFAIASGDESAIADAEARMAKRSGTVPVPRTLTVPAQLPHPPELVGREHLVAEVNWLLGRQESLPVPVIVITGPGGIGKTALALRTAHESRDRYPDGQLYMELRDAAGAPVDVSEVAAQFLRTLGVPRVPETKAERLAVYRTVLAGRRILVVLDDAADGSQVSELVPASAGCAVLVTARQRLPELSESHHVPSLEPLSRAYASELFMRVVRDAGISLDGDPAAVEAIVDLCGGLPLALRIAAALRVHDHPRPTAELARRLATQGPDAFAYGRLSVTRTIGAGFDRLDPAGRQLFLGLGLLPLARFGLWTVTALLRGPAADGTAALSQLTSSFMLESIETELRYRFHDLTREYAHRRAHAEYQGDHDLVPVAAYQALLTLTRRAHACLYGGDFEVVHSPIADWEAPPEVLGEVSADPLAWFEKERVNIRAAVEHCAELGLVDLCWDLAVSAHEFYTIGGYFDDWHATHVVALRACRKADDRRGEGVVLACLNQPALAMSRRTDTASELADLERSVRLLADCGDRHGQAIALRALANALRRNGHLTRPLELFDRALAHYRASGDQVGQWQTLRFIGQTHLDRGEFGTARRVLEEAEAVAVQMSHQRLIAQTRYWIGQACLAMADTDRARAAFDAVLRVYSDAGSVGHAYALHGLGDVGRCIGDCEAAERDLTIAAELASEGADAALEGRVWLSIADLRHAQGQLDRQVAALQQAVAVSAANGGARLECRALTALARALTERGDLTAADRARARLENLYDAAGLPAEDRLARRTGSVAS